MTLQSSSGVGSPTDISKSIIITSLGLLSKKETILVMTDSMSLFPMLQFPWQNLNSPLHLQTSNMRPLYPATSASSNGALWFWRGILSCIALWSVAYNKSFTLISQLLSSPLHLTPVGSQKPQAIGHFFLNVHLLQNLSGLFSAFPQDFCFSQIVPAASVNLPSTSTQYDSFARYPHRPHENWQFSCTIDL